MIRQEQIPHILKYMGGKREMLEDIGQAVSGMNLNATDFCDLFAGTAIVSYAFSDEFNVISNDIQAYSSIFGNTYFSNFAVYGEPEIVVKQIMEECDTAARENYALFSEHVFHYDDNIDFISMERIENAQMSLMNKEFGRGFSFFMRYYSGTYWSFEQCLWIDSIRKVAESHSNSTLFYLIMSSLVFAMSYCAQSTGHFAQFRTLTKKNYKSVLLYRQKSISVLFKKKLLELLSVLNHPLPYGFRSSSLDYVDCISTLKPNTIVYADPPYSSVHYSRFYHALETIVRYDHPKLEYKGRYREGRYQSPFDQKSGVANAFRRLFESIRIQRCHLLLSYSDNALLSIEDLNSIAKNCLDNKYDVQYYSRDYKHMKMGRSDEYQMDVHELLIAYLT